MKRKGWLSSFRRGRRSLYQLTRKGRDLLDEGGRRIFGPRSPNWDGDWHLVIYSLPQGMRSLRRQLRTRLSWLGYGMFLPGTMVSAYPRRESVIALIRELGVQSYVHYFTRARLEMKDSREVVERCWDLVGLNRRYARFIERYQQTYEESLERSQEQSSLPTKESFVNRFWATYEFSSFPREDPYLPPELLPPDWLGTQAAGLISKLRTLLLEPSETYIQETLGLLPEGQVFPEERAGAIRPEPAASLVFLEKELDGRTTV